MVATVRRFILACAALALGAPAYALTVGGDLTYTTDYIFRGISQTGDHGAAQLDVHAALDSGTFAGAFVSNLGRVNGHGWDCELAAYLGHRFDITPAWNTTLTAINYSYLGGDISASNDYQEVSVGVSYLDRVTLSFAYAPDEVRYDMAYRLGRYAAYVTDLSGQIPLAGHFFATAGIGRYSLTGPEAVSYAYGNAGLAFEYKALRIEAGYYAVDHTAASLFPWALAASRFAGTVSWHF